MKVSIRPLKETDAFTSYKWRNDPEVFKYTGNVYTEEITLQSELEWINRVILNQDEYRCAIMVDGEYVGNTYLTGIKEGKAWFHIFIGNKDYWGKGIAKVASSIMIDYAFNNLNLNAVSLSVHEDNASAIGLYSGLGFQSTKKMSNRIIMEISK